MAVLSLALATGSGRLAAVDVVTPTPMVADAPTVPPAPVLQKPLTPSGADVMTAQPSPQHVWIAGHWHWNGGQYGWVAGAWELPPVENAVWVASHWEAQGNGYVLVEGYWQQTMAAEAPPPVVVQQEQVIVADGPPPPPIREVIVEHQRPGYFWVDGYWGWSHGRHVWIAGHWERPPHPNAVWVQPRWEHRGHDYVFVQGFWREGGVSVGVSNAGVSLGVSIGGPSHHEEIVLRSAPPAPMREVVRERDRPSPRHVWIAGYWGIGRDGRHEWVPGRWELPPRERAVWVEPRWEHRRDGGYVFIEGSWR